MKLTFIILYFTSSITQLYGFHNNNNDDVLNENFLYQIKKKALPFIQPYAPVFYIRMATLLTNAAYDAISPYHVTAKGIYSDIPKRPEVERTTRNKNIAIAYASLRILNNQLPSERFIWEQELRNAGLDPLDISLDLTTPQGIGNFAGENVLNVRINDGMNQEGNTKYHKARYSNSIPYKPKNSPYKIRYPENWQPLIEKIDYGLYSSQIHVVPQLGWVKPYAIKDVNLYHAPIPFKSKLSNMDDYVEQVQEILRESYTLDDKKKMAAEFFDDKVWSLDGSLEAVIKQHKFNLDEYVFLQLAVKIALFDASIVSWKEKIKYDTVRPITAIRYLYGNSPLKSWGGAGNGAVEDIKGNEWQSYLPTPAHTEYPSGSTCFCATQAAVLERYFNSNHLNFSIEFPMGSSRREPCKTPRLDLKLDFVSFDDFVQVCGLSRLYGGVHFLESIKEAMNLCRPIADVAFEFVQSQTSGHDNNNKYKHFFNV